MLLRKHAAEVIQPTLNYRACGEGARFASRRHLSTQQAASKKEDARQQRFASRGYDKTATSCNPARIDMTLMHDEAGSSRSTQPGRQAASLEPRIRYIPRQALAVPGADTFSASGRAASNKCFTLSLRAIGAKLQQEMDAGPQYLRGDYPIGILAGRHERRRIVTGTRASGWRNADGSDTELSTSTASQIQSTFSPRFGPETVPILVSASKKRVDKHAVIRNKVRTRIAEALREVASGSRREEVLALVNPAGLGGKSLAKPQARNTGQKCFFSILVLSTEAIKTPMHELKGYMEAAIDALWQRQRGTETSPKGKRSFNTSQSSTRPYRDQGDTKQRPQERDYRRWSETKQTRESSIPARSPSRIERES